jgi:SOS-response transcriptional repressor LexA
MPPRPPGRPRDDPEKLSPRQQEWLDAARRHLERTGLPPSRIELVVVMGFVNKGAAAYGLGVLERKGRLVRVYNASGGRRIGADTDRKIRAGVDRQRGATRPVVDPIDPAPGDWRSGG